MVVAVVMDLSRFFNLSSLGKWNAFTISAEGGSGRLRIDKQYQNRISLRLMTREPSSVPLKQSRTFWTEATANCPGRALRSAVVKAGPNSSALGHGKYALDHLNHLGLFAIETGRQCTVHDAKR
jgi:hypothetical protein